MIQMWSVEELRWQKLCIIYPAWTVLGSVFQVLFSQFFFNITTVTKIQILNLNVNKLSFATLVKQCMLLSSTGIHQRTSVFSCSFDNWLESTHYFLPERHRFWPDPASGVWGQFPPLLPLWTGRVDCDPVRWLPAGPLPTSSLRGPRMRS